MAKDRLIEAELYIGIEEERNIIFNRHYLMRNGRVVTNPGRGNPDIVRPVGPIDPTLLVVFVESRCGKILNPILLN